jgi:hypothetical protein
MRKLGLDYETLAKLNPRLIYCGTYGFSERGPTRAAGVRRHHPGDERHRVAARATTGRRGPST